MNRRDELTDLIRQHNEAKDLLLDLGPEFRSELFDKLAIISQLERELSMMGEKPVDIRAGK